MPSPCQSRERTVSRVDSCVTLIPWCKGGVIIVELGQMLRLSLRRGCLSRLGRGRELGTLRQRPAQTRPHQSDAAHTNTQNMCLAISRRRKTGNKSLGKIIISTFVLTAWPRLTACDPSADCLRVLSLIWSQSRSWRPPLSLRGHKNLPQNATSRRIIFYVSQMLYPSVPSPDSDQGDFLSSQIISRLCFLCAVSSK